jgi:hypothetical protein
MRVRVVSSIVDHEKSEFAAPDPPDGRDEDPPDGVYQLPEDVDEDGLRCLRDASGGDGGEFAPAAAMTQKSTIGMNCLAMLLVTRDWK